MFNTTGDIPIKSYTNIYATGRSADILGGQVPWADTIHHRVTSPAGAFSAVALNAGVAARLASDWGKVAAEGGLIVFRPRLTSGNPIFAVGAMTTQRMIV